MNRKKEVRELGSLTFTWTAFFLCEGSLSNGVPAFIIASVWSLKIPNSFEYGGKAVSDLGKYLLSPWAMTPLGHLGAPLHARIGAGC